MAQIRQWEQRRPQMRERHIILVADKLPTRYPLLSAPTRMSTPLPTLSYHLHIPIHLQLLLRLRLRLRLSLRRWLSLAKETLRNRVQGRKPALVYLVFSTTTRAGSEIQGSMGASRAGCYLSYISAICKFLSLLSFSGKLTNSCFNRNRAQNAYMLQALEITHVVSVGECALVPPQHDGESSGISCERPARNGAGPHYVPGKGPGGQGPLWIEDREGRIKVLGIKGVCDDGIDKLEPQL